MGRDVLIKMQEILVALSDPSNGDPIVVSTRRARKTVNVLKAQAFIEGRMEVTKEDLKNILPQVCWTTRDQMSRVMGACDSILSDPVERLLADATLRLEGHIKRLEELSASDTNNMSRIPVLLQNFSKELKQAATLGDKKRRVDTDRLSNMFNSAMTRKMSEFVPD
jgi:hypothetical protein